MAPPNSLSQDEINSLISSLPRGEDGSIVADENIINNFISTKTAERSQVEDPNSRSFLGSVAESIIPAAVGTTVGVGAGGVTAGLGAPAAAPFVGYGAGAAAAAATRKAQRVAIDSVRGFMGIDPLPEDSWGEFALNTALDPVGAIGPVRKLVSPGASMAQAAKSAITKAPSIGERLPSVLGIPGTTNKTRHLVAELGDSESRLIQSGLGKGQSLVHDMESGALNVVEGKVPGSILEMQQLISQNKRALFGYRDQAVKELDDEAVILQQRFLNPQEGSVPQSFDLTGVGREGGGAAAQGAKMLPESQGVLSVIDLDAGLKGELAVQQSELNQMLPAIKGSGSLEDQSVVDAVFEAIDPLSFGSKSITESLVKIKSIDRAIKYLGVYDGVIPRRTTAKIVDNLKRARVGLTRGIEDRTEAVIAHSSNPRLGKYGRDSITSTQTNIHDLINMEDGLSESVRQGQNVMARNAFSAGREYKPNVLGNLLRGRPGAALMGAFDRSPNFEAAKQSAIQNRELNTMMGLYRVLGSYPESKQTLERSVSLIMNNFPKIRSQIVPALIVQLVGRGIDSATAAQLAEGMFSDMEVAAKNPVQAPMVAQQLIAQFPQSFEESPHNFMSYMDGRLQDPMEQQTYMSMVQQRRDLSPTRKAEILGAMQVDGTLIPMEEDPKQNQSRMPSRPNPQMSDISQIVNGVEVITQGSSETDSMLAQMQSAMSQRDGARSGY